MQVFQKKININKYLYQFANVRFIKIKFLKRSEDLSISTFLSIKLKLNLQNH